MLLQGASLPTAKIEISSMLDCNVLLDRNVQGERRNATALQKTEELGPMLPVLAMLLHELTVTANL